MQAALHERSLSVRGETAAGDTVGIKAH